MNINLIAVLTIIIIHWFADYIMQKGSWAIGKSKNWSDLLKHTTTYSLIWLIIGLMSEFARMCLTLEITKFNYLPILWFTLITFICHTITDYFTSKHSSKQYQKQNFGGDIPRGMDFFVTLGGDQVLHLVQLLLTYYLLTNA